MILIFESIGSCWVAYFDHKKVADIFDLPEHIKPVALLPIGYPAEDCVPLKGYHDAFRPMEEIVTIL